MKGRKQIGSTQPIEPRLLRATRDGAIWHPPRLMSMAAEMGFKHEHGDGGGEPSSFYSLNAGIHRAISWVFIARIGQMKNMPIGLFT
jgi:hypothetical protein